MAARVLLTGIGGYIGQYCGAELLNSGFEVVGTVRSLSKADATRSAIAAVAPVEQLRFVEADLLSDAGWEQAMQGCTYVMHVASPFVLAEPKDESELIGPAVEGTRRVIAAAKKAGVRRVVLTSSTVAMVTGKPDGRYGPDAWSDPNAKIGAYARSKTLAERAAWEAVAGSEMELVVINPGVVFGPPLGAEVDGQSIALMRDMIGGKMPMIPDVAMGMVDVRDVARLHVAAMTSPDAVGRRFIAATAEPISMSQFAQILRDAGYSKVPSRKAPNLAIRIMSLFDREARGMLPSLGKRAAYDNRSTFDILDWQPTPMETSIREMAASISR
ncbi:MAG: aldehyde reductase [Actinobacteria bacterium]|nr:aldehyde reductase [Actinomycetota bacterium]